MNEKLRSHSGDPLRRICLAIALMALLAVRARAQFSLDGSSLQTGGGDALVTATEELSSALPEGLFLRFRFSYGTDEAATAGEFKDSFSIGLFGDEAGLNALFLTADVFGLHLAPENTGGIELAAGSLQLTPAEIPGETAGFNASFSFNVQAEIPAQFSERSANLRLDLFDNGNSAQSLGYIDQISVVPEPGMWSLVALFLSISALVRKASK